MAASFPTIYGPETVFVEKPLLDFVGNPISAVDTALLQTFALMRDGEM